MALELYGTIKIKLAPQSGSSARGAWIRQDFILEYQDGNFPAEVCFTAWGQDKVSELDAFQAGSQVKVSFNVRAREYNGKWYNDLRIWRITSASAGQNQAPQRPAAPSYMQAAPAPSYAAPAPTFEDMPAAEPVDDLPF